MNTKDLVVAVFDTHSQAEQAIRTLYEAGFDMKKVSIIGKDYHTEEQFVGYFNAGDRAVFFGKFGALWGGLAGLLFSSAFLFVPVLGHLVVLGPIASAIAGGLQGAALGGGIGALAGALSAVGVPKDSVQRYTTELKADKFLVMVHGDGDVIARARELLAGAGSTDVQAHHAGA